LRSLWERDKGLSRAKEQCYAEILESDTYTGPRCVGNTLSGVDWRIELLYIEKEVREVEEVRESLIEAWDEVTRLENKLNDVRVDKDTLRIALKMIYEDEMEPRLKSIALEALQETEEDI
jgi:hypothetical protein